MIRESLNLVGDEGLEEAIEDVFDVRFTDSELVGMVNLGAIHDVLCARIPERDGACETSMTFYRLRRALLATGVTAPIAPRTPLPEIFHDRPAAELRRLSKASGLRLPLADSGPLMAGSGAAGLVAAIMGAVALVPKVSGAIWIAGAAAIIAVVLAALDRGRLPGSTRTVGDLARRAAPLNYGALVRDGARSDGVAIWTVLRELIADVADVRAEEIDHDTRIYPDKRAVA